MRKSIFTLLILSVFITSCENEPIGTVEFNSEKAIEVGTPLYQNIERLAQDDPDDFLVCIDFNYAFALNIFDEEQEYIQTLLIEDDAQFSVVLSGLEEGHFIGLSFPILSTTLNGEIVEINDTDELKLVIDKCIEEETVGNCNNILSEPDCKWVVVEGPEGQTNPYIGSYFDVNSVGVTSYHREDDIYFGAWITYFIENELHLNIFLDDEGEIAEAWNIDWILTVIDNYNMKLERGDAVIFIQKECEESCSTHILTECETESGSEQAAFNLEDALECLPNGVLPSNYEVSFHLNITDAVNNENPLSSPYNNIENPQIIKLRIVDMDTEEISYTFISLATEDCSSD
ncbi:MAG: hypothetical protein ACWA5P_05015 [bacterium]